MAKARALARRACPQSNNGSGTASDGPSDQSSSRSVSRPAALLSSHAKRARARPSSSVASCHRSAWISGRLRRAAVSQLASGPAVATTGNGVVCCQAAAPEGWPSRRARVSLSCVKLSRRSCKSMRVSAWRASSVATSNRVPSPAVSRRRAICSNRSMWPALRSNSVTSNRSALAVW